ncbi:hypothetical protein PHLGIDRAFT_470013 [Phlebiopsis gigantea 11061_1 CR5-6]|uniref:Uncharacterized protein n=1 Tax=Phlebiopsis gigantea (strain 11061_1 CR5-6) TaxID=745531 RepID=A0A0C3PJ43_PHLG1|nr:hypothetical protein PHLGIDRAFT_470013 [Phlebiopsis gigantea 11061_1 CR5-6]
MGQDLILSLSRVALQSAGSEAGRSQGQHEVTNHIPELPQEIVEHILDQISPSKHHHNPENKETLQNCTLVCRRWLTRSSLCLFKCVSVSPKGVLRLLARAGTSERLKTYIQGIYIVHGTFVSVSPTQWLPGVFATFVHIQHLRLRYGVPEEAPDPFAMLHPRSQSLASLHLDDVAVSNLPACLRFFGNVGELVLRNVSGDVAPVAKPPHLLVRAISLEKSFPNCLSMLKAIVSPFMLTTLKIYVDSAQANGIVEALDDFLRELGGNIEHLSLHVGPGTKRERVSLPLS